MGTIKDIREAVSAELEFDPLVDDADIHVVNVNGDVALNGTVPSYPQYLEATAAAQRVGGVRNVHNHLEVVLPDADALRGRGGLQVLRVARHGAVERDVPVDVHDMNVRVVDERVELELRVDGLADALGGAHSCVPFPERMQRRICRLPRVHRAP